jgi:DNA mismatch repair protein MSH5
MGYKLLKQWFLRPSLSIDTIEKRQAGVAMLMHNGNSDAVQELGRSLERVEDIPKILGRMKVAKANRRRGGGECLSLHAFVVEALNIRNTIQNMVGWRRVPMFTKVCPLPTLHCHSLTHRFLDHGNL